MKIFFNARYIHLHFRYLFLFSLLQHFLFHQKAVMKEFYLLDRMIITTFLQKTI
jgi:hypothetical protein